MKSTRSILSCCALLALLGPLAHADDPPQPKPPTVPAAALVGPALATVAPGYPVFLDASGSTTDYPIEWSVSPTTPLLKLDQDGRKRVYGLLPSLSPDTDYLVTVVALGKDQAGNPTGSAQTVKFSTRAAPQPTPVVPPVVTPPNPTPTADPLGLTAATAAILRGMTWTPESTRFRQATLGPIFADVAGRAGTYSTPQAMLLDIETRYKAAIGADLWPQWRDALFKPLQGQLQALQAAKRLATQADLAEALTEISNALKGN